MRIYDRPHMSTAWRLRLLAGVLSVAAIAATLPAQTSAAIAPTVGPLRRSISAWHSSSLTSVKAASNTGLAAQTEAEIAVSELNRYRVAASLPPVTLDPLSPAPLHAHYLAVNKGSPEVAGLLVHTERPVLPGYTPEGAAVAEKSNIALNTTVVTAVRGLVDVPLHRHAMLAPGLNRIGVGGEDGQWVIDLSSTVEPPPGQVRVVAFPAPGQMDVPLAFSGDEIPNPLKAIPGVAPDARVGYAITLHLYGCDPTNVEASLTGAAGPVPIHVAQPGTMISEIGGERPVPMPLMFAQQPLQPLTTYRAQVTTTCRPLGRRTYSWSFTTRGPPTPGATEVAVMAADAGGWQSMTVRLYDANGLPAEGALLGRYAWEAEILDLPPRVEIVTGQAAHDGELRARFHRGDAKALRLRLQVAYAEHQLDLAFALTSEASGTLSPLPQSGPIPFNSVARADWEHSVGPQFLGPLVTAAPPPGTGLLADDFSDPDRGSLPLASSDARVAGFAYLDGEYQLRKLDNSSSVALAELPGEYRDASLAVDVRPVGPTASHQIMVACRYTADASGYALIVLTDVGLFAVARLDRGSQSILSEQRSNAIQRGTATNRIELSCTGNTISATANGQVLASVQDARYAEGAMLIGVWADGSGAEARFDNLVVTQR